MMRIVLLICVLALCKSQAQSPQTFTWDEFYEILTKNHPLAKQANLLLDDAQAELLMARGGFDPKLEGSFDRKLYKGKEYFNRWDNVLKVPLWWAGADLKMGFDRNVGATLSDDIETPLGGTPYAGIVVPLGQGFLIDARRNTLLQARVFQKISEAERVKMLNKLVLSAAKDYWNWYFSHQQLALTATFYNLAKTRFEAVRKRAVLQDIPAVDTLEAQITLQDRSILLSQAQVEATNARLLVSNYLWDKNEMPLEISENWIPQTMLMPILEKKNLEILLQNAEQRHPDLQKIDFKLEQLAIEKRFRREMLKPQFSVGVGTLWQSSQVFNQTLGNRFLQDNYKLSVDLALPLFLRKERGKLNQIKIKELSTQLERKNLTIEVQNTLRAAYNDLLNIEQQINTQIAATSNQNNLLKAENQKFDMGESSLFLVNAREAKLNEMQVKIEALKAKYEKARANLLFTAGLSR